MTFGMTPVGGFPPASADDFPNYIQFQEDGVNLGGPDADTVNFTGNVSATRGEGENANIITVEIPVEGSGGSSPSTPPQVLAVVLSATSGPTFADPPETPWDTWASTVLVESTQASWDNTTGITFAEEGMYEVHASVYTQSTFEGGYPAGDVITVVYLPGAYGIDQVFHSTNRGTGDGQNQFPETVTASFFYRKEAGEPATPPLLAVSATALTESSPGDYTAAFFVNLTVRYLGALPVTEPYISDTFTGSAGTELVDHTPEIGSAWDVADGLDATLVIDATGTKLRRSASAGTTRFWSTTDIPVTDGLYVQFNVTFTSNNICEFSIARHGDTAGNDDKFFEIHFESTAEPGNTYYQLGSGFPAGDLLAIAALDVSHLVRLEVQGTTLEFYFDGVLIDSTSVTQDWLEGPIGGFITEQSTSSVLRFDNFEVGSLG